jgi:hypothetical protein
VSKSGSAAGSGRAPAAARRAAAGLLDGTHLSVDGFHVEADAALQSARASLAPVEDPDASWKRRLTATTIPHERWRFRGSDIVYGFIEFKVPTLAEAADAGKPRAGDGADGAPLGPDQLAPA